MPEPSGYEFTREHSHEFLNQSPGVQKVLEEFQQVEGELAVQQTVL